NENAAAGSSDSTTTGEPVQSGTDEPTKTGQEEPPADDQQPADANQTPAKPPVSDSTNDDDSIVVVAQPESVTALINKHFALPEDYEPADLVYPDVPFTFSEKIEKRKIRQVAADALVQLFAGAKEDGVPLAGVSAYRSYSRQKTLFDNYVREDGLEKARTYSAVPGT
ncbi:D-alanyl-D-alanine carboxypeptidase family protein, partial [Paenibacillus sepulcri]|nr:D-alanyl-D-alanine carboxypeptidase family protein [Paenibacillus sepulcri]